MYMYVQYFFNFSFRVYGFIKLISIFQVWAIRPYNVHVQCRAVFPRVHLEILMDCLCFTLVLMIYSCSATPSNIHVHVTCSTLCQYSNVYVTMPEVRLLLASPQLQRECLDYVALPGVYCTVPPLVCVHENISLIQSLALMCSAIIVP